MVRLLPANFIKFHTISSGSDGWNPGAGQANMDIAGPDLNDIVESSVIIVNVDDDNHGAIAANCGVYDKFVQSSSPFNHGFSIHCDGSPSTAARLDIAVLNPS